MSPVKQGMLFAFGFYTFKTILGVTGAVTAAVITVMAERTAEADADETEQTVGVDGEGGGNSTGLYPLWVVRKRATPVDHDPNTCKLCKRN